MGTIEELVASVNNPSENTDTNTTNAWPAVDRSDALYSSFFENGHSVMLIIDPESGHILDVNQKACTFYGYRRDQILHMRITDINTLSPEAVFEEMERAKNEKRRYFNFRHRLKGGEIREVEVYSGPIMLDGRKVLYSIVHDVTARRQIERALKESERNYRQIFNAMNDGLVLADLEGAIVDVNPGFCRLYGYIREEIVGAPVLKIIHPDYHHVFEDFKAQIRATGRFMGETIEVRKDGSYMHAEIRGAMLHFQERELLMGIIRDITARKQSEHKLKAERDKLKKALDQIQVLRGMLPICAACKKIRDDKGYWNQIESYIQAHSEAEFSHSICPECSRSLYPDITLR